MNFKLIKKLKSGVRFGDLKTAHGVISTPFFMPVGTVGSVKSVSAEELASLGAQIVLSNTYHLYLRPGEKLIKKLGGIHKFMNWPGPVLTDSGGYQVFSLGREKTNIKDQKSNIKNIEGSRTISNLVKIKEDGVEFTSFLDGSKHFFTPEKVVQIQLDLGVDIIMPLDVCPSGKASKAEVKKACETTIRWARRSREYFNKKIETRNSKLETNSNFQKNTNSKHVSDFDIRISDFNKGRRPLLFGIIQGGLHPDLRKWCTEEIIKIGFDGYAVGGLAVDHETRDMWKTVTLMGEIMPVDKPRYLMGVGTPDDLLKATSLGMDMFDCVLPTRMGRHGSAYIKNQKSPHFAKASRGKNIKNKEKYTIINLFKSEYRTNKDVIDKNCHCPACENGYSCAYLSHLLRSGEILGVRLTTMHNLYQYLNLMNELRKG